MTISDDEYHPTMSCCREAQEHALHMAARGRHGSELLAETIARDAESMLVHYPDLRVGQAVFNTALAHCSERANALRGSGVDPFYDDSRIWAFLDALTTEASGDDKPSDRDDMSVYDEIRAERERAHAKHGETSMESTPVDDPTGRRYRILLEEVGEVATEFNDAEIDQRPVNLANVRKELIQVAAMAAAWADRIEVSR